MKPFELDSRLRSDGHVLGRLELCQVLLMNNAAIPWFVLVPETSVTEVIDLPAVSQALLWAEVARVAEFVRADFPVEKLNVAAIGNVVSQLHVHVVGRHQQDYCWPDVVWGRNSGQSYSTAEIDRLTRLAQRGLSLKAIQ